MSSCQNRYTRWSRGKSRVLQVNDLLVSDINFPWLVTNCHFLFSIKGRSVLMLVCATVWSIFPSFSLCPASFILIQTICSRQSSYIYYYKGDNSIYKIGGFQLVVLPKIHLVSQKVCARYTSVKSFIMQELLLSYSGKEQKNISWSRVDGTLDYSRDRNLPITMILKYWCSKGLFGSIRLEIF